MKKYQKDAQNRYNSKFDIVQARLPKGTKERIQILDYTINAFIVEAVESMLKSLETPTAPIPEPTESVSQIVEETKEVDQMAAVELMPWEEGYTEPKPDPVYEQEMEEVNDVKARYYVRKYGESILTDSVLQGEILLHCGGEVLAKVKEYVDHPELLEEPEQENKPHEKGIQSLEELNEELAKKRAEDAAKISAEEERRQNYWKNIQESNKADIVNHFKRMRNGSEMTEEEKKKETEREEWKKRNNKEFGV